MYADAADVMDGLNSDVREVGKMSVIEKLPYPTALKKSMYVYVCKFTALLYVCIYTGIICKSLIYVVMKRSFWEVLKS